MFGFNFGWNNWNSYGPFGGTVPTQFGLNNCVPFGGMYNCPPYNCLPTNVSYPMPISQYGYNCPPYSYGFGQGIGTWGGVPFQGLTTGLGASMIQCDPTCFTPWNLFNSFPYQHGFSQFAPITPAGINPINPISPVSNLPISGSFPGIPFGLGNTPFGFDVSKFSGLGIPGFGIPAINQGLNLPFNSLPFAGYNQFPQGLNTPLFGSFPQIPSTGFNPVSSFGWNLPAFTPWTTQLQNVFPMNQVCWPNQFNTQNIPTTQIPNGVTPVGPVPMAGFPTPQVVRDAA